jgi:hypothetical protein
MSAPTLPFADLHSMAIVQISSLAQSITDDLKPHHIGTTLRARKHLDLLNDNLPFSSFNLGNFLALWKGNNVRGTCFFLPFTVLNLAMRSEVLSLSTRFSLLQRGFFVFFKIAVEYPTTRSGAETGEKIVERGSYTEKKKL